MEILVKGFFISGMLWAGINIICEMFNSSFWEFVDFIKEKTKKL